MNRDYLAYGRQLISLLPKGRLWRNGDVRLQQLLNGAATELARVDTRVTDLLNENDVRTTIELVVDHEIDFGLPEGVLTTTDKSLADRRLQLLVKVRELGSLNKQYFIDLAAIFGYTIHIDEFTPAWCGIAVCDDPCGDQQVLFNWLVNVHYDFINPFTSYSNVEYLFGKLKPAHTVVLFRLYGPGFSNGFNQGFNARISTNLVGGFSKGFSQGFNVMHGGGFAYAAFSSGFSQIK